MLDFEKSFLLGYVREGFLEEVSFEVDLNEQVEFGIWSWEKRWVLQKRDWREWKPGVEGDTKDGECSSVGGDPYRGKKAAEIWPGVGEEQDKLEKMECLPVDPYTWCTVSTSFTDTTFQLEKSLEIMSLVIWNWFRVMKNHTHGATGEQVLLESGGRREVGTRWSGGGRHGEQKAERYAKSKISLTLGQKIDTSSCVTSV